MHTEAMTVEVAEHFWARVTIGSPAKHMPQIGPCWNYSGSTLSRYGAFNRGGVRQLAHRLSWMLTVGPIPPGMLVCHHCDNRLCVRPTHLFLGTAQDNKDDWVRKFRRLGESPGFYARNA